MNKIAYIMRGLPGSGKSTLARSLRLAHAAYGSIAYHSTDSYHTDPLTGKYNWDPKIAEYHRLNQVAFRNSCEEGLSLVICDNTNITLNQMQPYIAAAKANGYIVQIITVGDPTDPEFQELCFARGTHYVPLEVIQRMGKTFELHRNVFDMPEVAKGA